MFTLTTIGIGTGTVLLLVLFWALVLLRRVVPTNEVHIVQYRKKTTSYGKDMTAGNSYYEWPSWMPWLGMSKSVLPVSVFDLDLPDYQAYDEARLPFVVHVKAFFRIADSNKAAQMVENFEELEKQLIAIVQGSVRTILASHKLEDIMQGRSTFGEAFTKEVKEQLTHWGVEAVKNIELMDIRDAAESQVIDNIMAKKKSHIEMESRLEVAKNHKLAKIAEIEAHREVEVQAQQAKQVVGLRTVEAKRQVDLANQQAEQVVKEAERSTKEKEMAVLQVDVTRKAEIAREAALVKADQEMKAAVLSAEGRLASTKLEAEGVSATGKAKAEAEKVMQLAPVEAQIVLAKEIGNNQGYQTYLIRLKETEVAQAVGVEQAKALQEADVKVIVNGGTPSEGVTKLADLFSSRGGTELGAMLEGLKQSPTGQRVLEKLTGEKKEPAKVAS